MRIAYLDCFSGVSGDMFLGALVDAGVSPQLLYETVKALDIEAELEISRVQRGGISATKVNVYAHGEKDLPREVFWQQKQPAHDHTHSHHHEHGRGLSDIRKLIAATNIEAKPKATAIRIFEVLGAAEAKVHNISIDEVHFHEVGAIDAIVDIACAAVGAKSLGVDEWICSPLNVGGGTVKCAHGTLPVPAPATVELLKDAPVYSSGPQVEMVTPTGAAIVKTLVSRFASFPAMKVKNAGYGAGSRDPREHPNVLRLSIGESSVETRLPPQSDKTGRSGDPGFAASPEAETITVLEANLDDLSPQVLAYAIEQLLAAGALDVFTVPAQMKKGRPGTLLTVLCKPNDADRLTQIVFAETTTLGVRRRDEQRQVLSRRWETVQTDWGPVRIKIGSMNGSISTFAPEYEDCKTVAEKNRVPLKTVMQHALHLYTSSRK